MNAMKNFVYADETHNRNTLNKKTGPDLVALHNKLSKELGGSPVKRFATKDQGVTRVMRLLEQRSLTKKPTTLSKPVVEKTDARRGTCINPGTGRPQPCREGSKQAIMVDMLSRPQGATMVELKAALAWEENTVRSGFGWDLKRKGYGVKSSFAHRFIESTGARAETFHLVYPPAHTKPVPHTPLKSRKV